MMMLTWALLLVGAALLTVLPVAMGAFAGGYSSGGYGTGEYGVGRVELAAAVVGGLSAAVLVPVCAVHLRDEATHSVWWPVLGTCALLTLVAGVIGWERSQDRIEREAAAAVAGGCGVGVVVMLVWGVLRWLDGVARQFHTTAETVATVIVVVFVLAVGYVLLSGRN